MAALPVTECEIDTFIAAFEGCTLPKAEWTHGAHLLTGACYVHASGEAEAIARMRLCVRRYNESVGGKNTETSGYHETITVAWIKLLNKLLERSKPIGRAEFAVLAVEHFREQKNIFSRYYDFDLVASKEARRSWVAPTLQPLELSEILD
jgi:hypothetical protein